MSKHLQDIFIDVPFYSQLDDSHGLDEYWKTRSCGIFALKMVLDYWRTAQGLEPISAKELLSASDVLNGRNDRAGWLHATIVMVARQYGFIAWRRGWMLSSDGRRRFAAEGAGERTLEIIDSQHREEAYPTLVSALDKGYPVIVSVARNFSEVHKPHMVVLTGVRRGEDKDDFRGFYYNDPYDPENELRKNHYVSLGDFVNMWRSQAIFIIPNPENE